MMKLAPLPTASVVNEKKAPQAPFPYPKLEDGLPSQNATPTHGLDALVTPDASSKNNPESNAEGSRMAELENMLNEAQSRAAIIEQEAYDKAYAAGEKSGLALGEKRAEQLLEAMQEVVESAEKELVSLKTQSIDAVMDIATAVIEQVVGLKEKDFGQALETSVQQVLTQFLVGYEGKLVLAVHAQDLEIFHRMVNLSESVKIRAYPEVSVGTCRLITDEQDILIDPMQSIQDAVQSARNSLLNHA